MYTETLNFILFGTSNTARTKSIPFPGRGPLWGEDLMNDGTVQRLDGYWHLAPNSLSIQAVSDNGDDGIPTSLTNCVLTSTQQTPPNTTSAAVCDDLPSFTPGQQCSVPQQSPLLCLIDVRMDDGIHYKYYEKAGSGSVVSGGLPAMVYWRDMVIGCESYLTSGMMAHWAELVRITLSFLVADVNAAGATLLSNGFKQIGG